MCVYLYVMYDATAFIHLDMDIETLEWVVFAVGFFSLAFSPLVGITFRRTRFNTAEHS